MTTDLDDIRRFMRKDYKTEEDMEDKETILILSQWRDEHFYGNEE